MGKVSGKHTMMEKLMVLRSQSNWKGVKRVKLAARERAIDALEQLRGDTATVQHHATTQC